MNEQDGTHLAIQRSCWSIFEGCSCRHVKDHDGYHECDDLDCPSFWTTGESKEWVKDQSVDNHKKYLRGKKT